LRAAGYGPVTIGDFFRLNSMAPDSQNAAIAPDGASRCILIEYHAD